jgi:hypothetical protein
MGYGIDTIPVESGPDRSRAGIVVRRCFLGSPEKAVLLHPGFAALIRSESPELIIGEA